MTGPADVNDPMTRMVLYDLRGVDPGGAYRVSVRCRLARPAAWWRLDLAASRPGGSTSHYTAEGFGSADVAGAWIIHGHRAGDRLLVTLDVAGDVPRPPALISLGYLGA